eukprot:TRINITY_DN10061_c0_g1_i1.p1 TRINITY_DN10061_c0_g1~~TRINITY_DN10061_c0_g1_i1.p1  ORF type:complete len:118 (-),score=39.45 TRINITY_DN10061_c0_g1_i1:45-398(-)
MIRRPPKNTKGVSSAASDVYKRQLINSTTFKDNNNWSRSEEFDKLNSENEKLKEEIKNLKLQERNSLYDYRTLKQENSELRSQVEILKAHVLCVDTCLLYTSPSPRDLSTSRMPSSA